ncbi:MAG TPA: ABC transporter substrate-binding protein [Hyphomicrobiaceae bacterium]
MKNSVKMTRRAFTSAVGAAALGIPLGLTSMKSAKANDDTVVFAGWGGNWQEAEREYFFKDFERETGIRVVDVPDLDLAKVKTMVDSGNVSWDVVQALDMWVADKDKAASLWEEIDYSEIQSEGVPKDLLRPYGAGVATFAMILAYNTKAFEGKQAPASWADYWDFEKFVGKRGMIDAPRYALEIALMAKGVPPKDLYPLDVEGALEHWDKIKNDVLWWDKFPQSINLLASGELAVTMTSHGRVMSLLEEEPDTPIKIVWSQGILTTDFLSIPKGSKRKKNAQKLISWMLDPKRQADYAKATGVGPSNFKALDSLDDATKKTLPSYYYQTGQIIEFNADWWSTREQELVERWNFWQLI